MKKGLIEEYKTLSADCSNIDYADKKAVKKRNKSIDRMWEIVQEIGVGQTLETPEQFADLLNTTENNTNLWAAIHLLEQQLPTDHETEKKALSIIELAASGESVDAMGYQFWLDEWKANHKK